MDHHTTRFLVSQRFGHIKCSISLNGEDKGMVRLTLEAPVGHFVDFTFAQAELATLHPARSAWPDVLTRLSIAQAHRNFIKHSRVFDETAEPLDWRLPQWIGDVRTQSTLPPIST